MMAAGWEPPMGRGPDVYAGWWPGKDDPSTPCKECNGTGRKFWERPDGRPTSNPCPNGCPDTWPKPEIWVCTDPTYELLVEENQRLMAENAALRKELAPIAPVLEERDDFYAVRGSP